MDCSGEVCITLASASYSIGPWRTVICRPSKLSNGGGDVVSHSSVVACHGLSGALGPLKRLQIALYKKMNCTAPSNNAATVMNRLVGICGTMKSATYDE